IKAGGGKIYSVGFVLGEGCPKAHWTLNETAKVGNGTYYAGNNATELKRIYTVIAQDILSLSYVNQTIVIIGNATSNLTRGNLSIEYDFSSEGLDLGEILLGGYSLDMLKTFADFVTLETKGFNETTGKTELIIPEGWNPFEAVIVAYSGPLWTKYAKINNTREEITIYNLDEWTRNLPYPLFGDPFRVNIPRNLINSTNMVTLYFGSNASHTGMPSNSSKIIYTIYRRPRFSYTEAKLRKVGCNWTIEGANGNFTIVVPKEYSGAKKCYYTNATGAQHDTNDVYDEALYNLLNNILDVDHDHKVDEPDFEVNYDINVIILGGVPFLHYTYVKAVSWR
ncbi:MAG: hypothetical protein NZ889_02460, partial [Candidatus Pacearchaeota archaeon]|nr:hypothetical protein [Candidatus Pacearchaeota archaeon]